MPIKFSIITATFNSELTIADALNTVAMQSYPHIEHLIIDGKSSDKTLDIIKKHGNKNLRLSSEADAGIYDALNKGISKASGDVIGFLHADDVYAGSQIIEKLAKLFQEKQVDAAYGDLHYVSKSDTSKTIRNWISGSYNYKKLKQGWMPPHPTFFVRKEIYEKYGTFDTSFKISADYDSILRFLGKEKISIAYLPEVLVKMRLGGESNKSLSNILRKMKEDARALQKNKMGGWQTVFLKNISKITQFF